MKAKLNGNDVEVIILDPAAAFAVEQGVMGGVGVDENEFPPLGEVYICYDGVDDDSDARRKYEEACAVVRLRDPEFEMPEFSVLMDQAFLVYAKSRYKIAQRGEREWSMDFINPHRMDTVYELTEDDRLIPYCTEG